MSVRDVEEHDEIVVAAHNDLSMDYFVGERAAGLGAQEGLMVEAEAWVKTIVTDEAIEAMRSFVTMRSEGRRQWVRDHGARPEPGAATGS